MTYLWQVITFKMEDNKTISIAILTYNEEKNIRDAVKSVLASIRGKFKDYEIIISDGGSSDKTLSIAEEIAKKNSKVRIVRNSNIGIGYSYARALESASMEYFTFFPGDNENSGDYFAKMLEKAGQADVIAPYTINQEVRSLSRRIISKGFVSLINALFGLKLKYYNGNSLYKTRELKKIKIMSYDFVYNAEILIKFIRSGHSYIEFGVKIKPTKKTTTFKLKNMLSIIRTVARLFCDVRIKNRKKYSKIGRKID